MMGSISAASGPVPVQVISANWSKPPDDGNSFGSDFQRLGLVSTSALSPIGKAWQTYPARQRSDLENCGIPLESWCSARDWDVAQANRLEAHPLMPRSVGETLECWRTAYLDAIGNEVSFERDRSTAMRSVRNGVPLAINSMRRDIPHSAKHFVRTFDVAPVRAQLEQIEPLNHAIRELDTLIPSLPHGEGKRIAEGNLAELVALRNAMQNLSLNVCERKRDELKVEIRALIALNDMTREVEREMHNGGADVPLRLSVRDGNWVLKPAASTSWFAKNKMRAANDAARLALLLGYPANQRVTLRMIRERGFGAHEYTLLLNDARSGGQGGTGSWLAGRALDIDVAKSEGSAVLDGAMQAFEGRRPDDALEPVLDDDMYDENQYATLPLFVGERPRRGYTAAQTPREDLGVASHRDVGEARAAPEAMLLEDDSDAVPHFVGPNGDEYARVHFDETSPAGERRLRKPGAVRFSEALSAARRLETLTFNEPPPPIPARVFRHSSPPRPSSLPPSYPPPPLPPIDE
ncbi:hypothetical protein [Pandoraea apista]|uniref:Uncharacterized protein n=1 Tax=Pandoraea apista TaxID=93218 RepID=A0ABX9ZTF9_9BURK|nr:hypothetical protein [Pandoraea apista]RRJ31258.1 hypothetical protein EIB05_12745 [Pandoraea apista]RRJ79927.1 hypothetical protein EIL82_11865 [Pandoraea apista]RSD11373.1 hypothetical protein EJB12_12750 [Pandoraea apista]RSK83436.1 hypothetical protein EJE96_10220 [Pandoraea apista]RSK84758.1 hypothetical protein EJE83_05040 [Pandoraea apista]